MCEEKKEFLHISGDEGFQSRTKSIFDGLNTLEPKNQSEEPPSREIIRARRRRPNQVPDHVLHPQKWTKYSLEEDGSEKLGRLSANEVNKHAAYSFLNELKERRKSSGESSDDNHPDQNAEKSSDGKHSFSKPKDPESDATENKGQVPQKEGVLVMPEYVVGQAKHKIKPKKSPVNLSSSRPVDDVQIGHLKQAEEDNDLEDKGGSNQEGSSLKKKKENPSTERIQFSRRKHKDSKNIRKHISEDDIE